ncbi:MAG: ketopantoate reductase family protein [Candidatus Heimdallarchaeota archaeon]
MAGKVLIIGAGAIGGVTGAILHQAGVDVSILTRKGKNYDAIKKNGLIIVGKDKPFHVPIYNDIKQLSEPFDHILVAVKNVDTENAVKKLKKLVSKETLIYSLQNGFGNTDVMRKHLPKEQIVAGVVGWGATYLGEGKFSITSTTGDFILGFEDGKNVADPRLLEIQKLLSIWKPTILTDNIIGFRWSKLFVNSIIAPIGGLLRLTVGAMLKHPKIAPIMGNCRDECIVVAEAHNIRLEKVDGMNIRNFFYKPTPNDGFFRRISGNLMSKIIINVSARRHGNIYPSLLVDLDRGRKTEVDYLSGYVMKKGKEKKIPTPINAFLVKAIHEIENGKREIGMENYQDLAKAAVLSQEKIKDR